MPGGEDSKRLEHGPNTVHGRLGKRSTDAIRSRALTHGDLMMGCTAGLPGCMDALKILKRDVISES